MAKSPKLSKCVLGRGIKQLAYLVIWEPRPLGSVFETYIKYHEAYRHYINCNRPRTAVRKHQIGTVGTASQGCSCTDITAKPLYYSETMLPTIQPGSLVSQKYDF